jgi:hypothetical protein
MHASGPMSQVSYRPGELYYWPVTWICDSGGRWHATRIRRSSGIDGENALRVQVVPPLSRSTAWIEVLAAARNSFEIADSARLRVGSARTIDPKQIRRFCLSR